MAQKPDESLCQSLADNESLCRSLTDNDGWPVASFPAGGTELWTLGDVAREFGTTPRALRFYEAKGLLSPQRQAGARLYGRAERQRLTLILKAKRLGFTLGEIRQMLAEPAVLSEPRALCMSRRQCFDQIKLLEARQREIDTALAELRRIYSSFYARLAAVAV